MNHFIGMVPAPGLPFWVPFLCGTFVRVSPNYLGDTTPASATVYVNSTITFAAFFVLSPTNHKQWQVSTDNGATFQNVAGATGTSLPLTNNTLETNVLVSLDGIQPLWLKS